MINKNKTYFVASDIHSFHDEFMLSLVNAGFDETNSNHIIIILGDIFDRGKQPIELLKFLLSLPKDRLILVTGNHEELLDRLIDRGYPVANDVINGTYDTLLALQDGGCLPQYRKLRIRMIDYYELGNRIFVHGWIPCRSKYKKFSGVETTLSYNPDWRNASRWDWEDARWLCGIECHSDGIIENGNTIYCGHYHTSYGNVRKLFPSKGDRYYSEIEFSDKSYFYPFVEDGIVALDGCVAFSGIVNVVTFSEEELNNEPK